MVPSNVVYALIIAGLAKVEAVFAGLGRILTVNYIP